MPILDQYGRPLPAPRASLAPSPRELRARYDAAETTIDNRRHWANADGLSAAAAADPTVRRKLRNRSRYECQESNSYAKGIVLTLANDTIGTGPRLQMLLPDEAANDQIEEAFLGWADEVQLAAKLRTLRVAKCVDGEAFARLVTNDRLRHSVKLDLRTIEADQVATPDLLHETERAIDGIRFDALGNPVEYHVLRSHPGGPQSALGLATYDRVSADFLLHWFRCDRAGQLRGIPETTPALPLFGQCRRFTLAVIGAAETAADYAAVLYTDSPAMESIDEVDALDAIPLDRRVMTTLPQGWKLGQIAAEQPTTTYREFKNEILNEAARCLNMPFNLAAGNSSNYNYASGRLDHQTYFRSIAIEQAHCEQVILNRVLAAWFDEAALVPGLLPLGGPISRWKWQWFWDAPEHVDPEKNANANQTNLESGQTSLPELFALQGKDWRVELTKQAQALNLTLAELQALLVAKLYGVPGVTAPAAAPPVRRARSRTAAAAE